MSIASALVLYAVIWFMTFLIALHEADMVLTMAFLSIPGVLFIVYGMLSRGVGPGGSRD